MGAAVVARKYPPGPSRAVPVVAHLSMLRNPLRFLERAARTHGDLVHLRLGSRHDYLVNRPDLVRDVLLAPEEQLHRSFPRTMKRVLGQGLLSSQGAYHRSQRRLIQPFFHHRRMAPFGEVITSRASRLCDRWREGEVVDLAPEMLHLTLQIAIQAVFDRDLDDGGTELLEALAPLVATTRKRRLHLADHLPAGLPFGPARTQELALARLDAFIHGLIQSRRREGEAHPDLLSLLLEVSADQDEKVADEMVRDETITMFSAGHETIANCLAWTFLLLAQHPEVESALHGEVDALPAVPGFEDIPRLRYTAMVLNESMRLYPPVWLMVRRPVEDFPLGEYLVPRGAYIHVSQWLMHRDPRYFPEPLRFDPLRWTPEAEAARPKYCYFPFGGGGRKCIGEGFALAEGVLALATIARRYRLRLVPGQRIEPEPFVTLRPKYGMTMRLHRR